MTFHCIKPKTNQGFPIGCAGHPWLQCGPGLAGPALCHRQRYLVLLAREGCFFSSLLLFRRCVALQENHQSGRFVSRIDFSRGFHSSAVCVGSHAVLSETTEVDSGFGSLYRIWLLLLWTMTIFLLLVFAESGHALVHAVLKDVWIQRPSPLLESALATSPVKIINLQKRVTTRRLHTPVQMTEVICNLKTE